MLFLLCIKGYYVFFVQIFYRSMKPNAAYYVSTA